MTKEQMAAHLDGREYPIIISPEEIADAKESGLVIVFGESDDLIEFRGAIRDEGGDSDGSFSVMVGPNGIIECPDEDEREVLAKFGVLNLVHSKGRKIKAIWDRNGISWRYDTLIPHATFDIKEEGNIYCRGIVFDLKELS